MVRLMYGSMSLVGVADSDEYSLTAVGKLEVEVMAMQCCPVSPGLMFDTLNIGTALASLVRATVPAFHWLPPLDAVGMNAALEAFKTSVPLRNRPSGTANT